MLLRAIPSFRHEEERQFYREVGSGFHSDPKVPDVSSASKGPHVPQSLTSVENGATVDPTVCRLQTQSFARRSKYLNEQNVEIITDWWQNGALRDMPEKDKLVEKRPWSSGPMEILLHGIDLLARDNDTNRRLAMLSIDNSVELMIKTFLGLPYRVTGIQLSRREYEEISESFPLNGALARRVLGEGGAGTLNSPKRPQVINVRVLIRLFRDSCGSNNDHAENHSEAGPSLPSGGSNHMKLR
jgi:hypothetical protein